MRKTLIITLFLSSLPFLIGADDSDLEKEKARVHALADDVRSLYGLDGVKIVIESLDEVAKEIGLTEEQLKTDIELKLRIAGINVLSTEESNNTLNTPILYLSLMVHQRSDGFVIFSRSMELSQRVVLIRNADVSAKMSPATVFAVTWYQRGMGGAGKYSAPEAIRNAVKDKVDKFINDFLKANPKK